MHVDKVKYTAHYDEYGQIKARWIGVDVALGENDDPNRAFQLAQEMTEDFHKKANQGTTITDAPGPPREIQVDKSEWEAARIEILVKDIENETVLRNPDGTGGLLAWKMIAATNPTLQAAFDLRKSQLELEKNLKDMEAHWPHQKTQKQ